MSTLKMPLAAAVAVCAAVAVAGAQAPAAPARVTDGATFAASGAVVRPADYREWVYVTSGLGMSYAPEAQQLTAPPPGSTARPPVFDNVFVNRQSYRAFLQSGRWPDGTMFILELRRGERHVSIDTGGQTQGAVLGIEAAVKDSARYAATGGWAYLGFGGANGLAVRLPSRAHRGREHVRPVLSDADRRGAPVRHGQIHLRPHPAGRKPL